MNKKRLVIVLCMVAIATGAMAFNRQAQWSNNNQSPDQPLYQKSKPTQQQVDSIPTHVVYGLLFREMGAFQKKAKEKAKKGEDGSSLRDYHKRQAHLNDQQAEVLDKIAADCESEVAKLDEKAKKITDEDRARHPGGKIEEGEALPAPPEELTALEDRRTATIIKAGEQLRAAFGEAEFQRFDEFVRRDIARKISPILPARTSRP